jgi:hypothetical protein
MTPPTSLTAEDEDRLARPQAFCLCDQLVIPS